MFLPSVAQQVATVKYLSIADEAAFQDVTAELDQLPRYEIANKPWPQFSTRCSASFAIAHTGSAILLKFFVKDDCFVSKVRPINTAVNKDNCVEFFVGFAPHAYYNIEFNCLGIGKIGYGRSRSDRNLLPVKTVRTVLMKKKLIHKATGFDWELGLVIPKEVFLYDQLDSFAGLKCKANFYKCGDNLPEKDFLVWNPIVSDKPDFHQPAFFGDLLFE